MRKILLPAIVLFISISACAHLDYPKSDHFDGSRFSNEDGSRVDKGFFDAMKWKLTESETAWPDQIDDNLKPDFKHEFRTGEVAVTFINHASEVIQTKSLTIVTDPVFSKRVSPVSWTGPWRHRKPGAELSEIPKIHVVIISHNHYDHMDLESLEQINKRDQPLFIVPLGNKKLLESVGIKNVIELDWWQKTKIGESTIALVPTKHWSARGVFDRSEALWGGYVIKSEGTQIFFAGDTGYGNHFREIRAKFGAMDISLLPIGAYEPRWFMEDAHMNPDEAVKAHLDLESRQSIGMHFGTFQLTNEGAEAPVIDLGKALAARNIAAAQFLAPKNGQTTIYKSAK